MIDRNAMENELQQARFARMEAQAASDDIEELIWEVQHIRRGRQRVVFITMAGAEQDLALAG